MEQKADRALGTVLIPKDAHKTLTLAQILRPVPELYRTVLHQNELAAVLLVIDIPAKGIPSNVKLKSFLRLIKINPSFAIGSDISIREATEDSFRYIKLSSKHEELLEATKGVKVFPVEDVFSVIKFIYYARDYLRLILQLELSINIDSLYLEKEISLSFVVSLGRKEEANAGAWLNQAKLTKSVTIIRPMRTVINKPLKGTQPLVIIPMELFNATDNISYFDPSLGKMTDPSATKGTNILIEDLQCDFTKTLVYDILKNVERSDLINLLKSKGEQLFSLELLHGLKLPAVLRPGEHLSMVVRIEEKVCETDLAITQNAGLGTNNESTNLSMVLPSKKQSATKLNNSSLELSLDKSGGELHSDRFGQVASKKKPSFSKRDNSQAAVLAGIYFTPLFIRTQYETSLCQLEYTCRIEWRISLPETVKILLSVSKAQKEEKTIDLLLKISSNNPEEMDLTLAVMKFGKESFLVFESIFFTLGKVEAGQTRDMRLRARVLKEEVDEDIILKVIDMASGSKFEFTSRVYASF